MKNTLVSRDYKQQYLYIVGTNLQVAYLYMHMWQSIVRNELCDLEEA